MGPQIIDHNNDDSDLLEKLSEYLPVSTTRVETALSRFPIHNLTKGETIPIRITQKGQGGDTDISWSVSPSRDYGEPRQLAYQLDTLVINKRIDQANRPLPRLLRLGSYREICRELGVQMNGKQKDAIKEALYQNAFAGITAKVSFKAADGRTRRFEKGFTRYSVYFAGEELPNESTADAVYIYLNEDYWQVLNNAVFRPLDFEYQKGLSAGAPQRFYELVSFAMFAALTRRRDEAKLVYSDYCIRAPQTRYFARAPMQKQMYKIHRPHVESGYIEKLRYRQTTDEEGQPDWEIFYTPGPRARAQFAFFRSRQRNEVIEVAKADNTKALRAPEAVITHVDRSPETERLTSRGITPQRAQKLLQSFRGGEEDLTAVLEWGDKLVGDAAGKIRNPAGFYVYLIEAMVLPPPGFQTSRVRKLQELAQQRTDEQRARTIRLQLAYEEYQDDVVNAYIASLNPAELEALVKAKRKAYKQTLKTLPDTTINEIAQEGVKKDVRDSGVVKFMTVEDFARTRNPDQLTLLTI